ncbi:MAG: N-6 DNA methylase, partial [Chloroflexota bacterium]
LGSVYESLLDFRPVVSTDNLTNTLNFALVTGTERKTTGSYYTRPELVHELIVSALEPVLNERLVAAGTDKAAKEQAILEITVCDPACGSGHFLLAAARRLGKELARVRSGEDQPGPEKFREAVREVISRSIYGVDLNPLAVDLCKLALWIEGYNAGMPHSFLDSHIRWGNSLIGATRALVKAGIPDEAFQAVTGDVKAVATAFKKRNQQERKLYQDTSHVQSGLNFEAEGELESRYKELVEQAKQVEALPDKNMAQVRRKTEEFSRSRSQGTVWWDELTTLHLWTAAFFTPLTSITNRAIPTSSAIFDPLQRRGDLVSRGYQLAAETGFFHWELEFPQVFERGGFDVVLGNPPWESMQLEELQFFASRDLGIAKAQNKAAREKLIKLLPQIKPHLAEEFAKAQYMQEATNRYVRNSKRFPLAAVGKMNTYALFAEHSCNLVNPQGRAGIIVPTGIATDDTTKAFFGDLNEQRSLASMYDFENREALFAGVHRSYKFSLLTIGKTTGPTKFVFFASNTRQLNDAQRKFTLTPEEIALLNPNTRTCPVFRTNTDAELTKKIYRLNPVLINEKNGRNDWGISFMQGLFNMSTDSYLFKNNPSEGLVPLYEAKLIHQFTHRWATYYGQECREFTCKELQAPNSTVTPRYWVESTLVEEQLAKRWSKQWLLGFRNVCRSTDERTAIFSLLPKFGVGHSMPLIFINPKITSSQILCLLALFNSFPFDYVVRQKIGGVNLTFGYVKQLPSLPPAAFSKEDVVYITERVLELVYTASDMQPFAVDVWAELDETGRERVWLRWLECNGAPLKIQNLKSEIEAPFIWNEARRAQIRAELDAKIAGLYGLTRDELRYILDPAEVYGPDFPGETFRVLKEKETKLYGEYRTRRLVLEAWDKN